MAARIAIFAFGAALATVALAEPQIKTRNDELNINADETTFEFRNPETRRTDRVAISSLHNTAARVRKNVEPTVEDLTAAVIALAESAKAQQQLAADMECPVPCDGDTVMETAEGGCTAVPTVCADKDRQIEELEAAIGAVADQGSAPYWTKLAAKVSTLSAAEPVVILGFNLADLYHPKLGETFGCNWKFTDTGSTAETVGVVAKEGEHYHIECTKPSDLNFARSAKLTIKNAMKEDANGEMVTVEYAGPTGGDVVDFDNNWFGYEVMGGKVHIHASGLDADTKYSIKMKSVNGRGTKSAECAMIMPEVLDCGEFPSGSSFRVSGDFMMVEATITGDAELSYGGQGKPEIKLPLCLNGKRDSGEADVDCGGFCVASKLVFGGNSNIAEMGKCAGGKKCNVDGDCDGGMCINDMCGGDGSSKDAAAASCKSIMNMFDLGTKKNDADDGFYWVKGDDNWGGEPKKVHCIMNRGRNGGGWMSLAKTWYQQSRTGGNGDFGNVDQIQNIKGESYNLAADFVNNIIGESQTFDVYAAQNGHHGGYSNGNYEYVTVENYKGKWRWSPRMPESEKTTVWKSWRKSDNALAWTGRLQCGHWGQYGINCDCGSCQNNPGAGAGCNIGMGRHTNWGWHHFYMSNTNSDTYLYICNGPQHSSGQHMNHVWYFREQRDIMKEK